MRWTDWLAVGMGTGALAGLVGGRVPGLPEAAAFVSWTGLTAWAIVDLRVQGFVDAICRVAPRDNQVVLTFDDGPDPATTSGVLDTLKRFGVRATFFMIGEKVTAHPDLARAVRQAGHDVGSHSYTHRWTPLTRVAPGIKSLRQADAAMMEALGESSRFFRPPYGLSFPALGRAVRSLELVTVGWSIRTHDAAGKGDPMTLAERTLSRVHAGDIILMHDAPERANGRIPLGPAMLEPLLLGLQTKGLRPVTLSEALAENSGKG